ncbi:hypothetical protein CPTAKMCE_048 [Salmonella phage vB_SenM-AKM_CE]|nr:hypothetical protein CPTAKMCE_048 [Salmonella phage vB_SenM-AKM_CE]
MKPNDLVTWAGRNGETRHGKVTELKASTPALSGGVLMRRNPVILRCVGIN